MASDAKVKATLERFKGRKKLLADGHGDETVLHPLTEERFRELLLEIPEKDIDLVTVDRDGQVRNLR